MVQVETPMAVDKKTTTQDAAVMLTDEQLASVMLDPRFRTMLMTAMQGQPNPTTQS